ncbi:MAG: anthranilate synthase component I, partial [Nitrospirae bacterium]|nr:anthranilate synthase component I [Nitrospirota bacterium]
GGMPAAVVRCDRGQVTLLRNGREERLPHRDNPLEAVRGLLGGYRTVQVPGLPRFTGGWVGYFGYDLVRYFETLPDRGLKGFDLPEFFLMLYDTFLVFDNVSHTIKVVANAQVQESGVRSQESEVRRAYEEAVGKIDAVIEKLETRLAPRASRFGSPLTPAPLPRGEREKKGEGPSATMSNMSQEAFEAAVRRAKEYIRAGDVFQVVLSQRFETPFTGDPLSLYRALRLINPSPYLFYLRCGEFTLLGSSPEVMVRKEGRKIELRPIAGTRPRGDSEETDRALERELLGDQKERAEHVMLVDLGRNDVGRVSVPGSVRVTEMMTIERYSHVMHIVSHVVGDLQEGLDAFDVLRACFPAGTVTGAPKIRAMEIIEELEPDRRGPYAGAVGYVGFSGNMDTCITIRSILLRGGKAYFQAGAGIVADSDPEKEYLETVNKAAAMRKAVEMSDVRGPMSEVEGTKSRRDNNED